MTMIERSGDAGDGDLLAGLRQGDAKAFERLMRLYNRRLFRTARGIVHDDAEAQDAVQEAYLRAFIALQSFRGESSLVTWLTRIVINQALGQQRKLGKVVLLNDELPEEESEMHATGNHGMSPASGCTPEEELSRGELRRQLQDAIDLLPPVYRIVFILRAVEGLSVEETALALEVSGDVVKTRLLRARAMLRERLNPAHEDEAQFVHDFQGKRCDDTVQAVLAQLRATGVIRDN
jgi:RNA polymerase sigma-70 factor, ECF subfamily